MESVVVNLDGMENWSRFDDHPGKQSKDRHITPLDTTSL
jgi:hypothetical protein